MQAPDLQPNQTIFLQDIENAWENQQFIRLILSQYKGGIEQLEKITVRPIELKGENLVSALYKYKTKDITKNYTWNEFQALLSEWIIEWQQLNLFAPTNESQLKFKKQQWILSNTKIKATQQVADQTQTKQHDREKKRWIEQDRLFLQLLGITDHKQNVVPSMARKWKQINKFVEIFSGAIQQAEFDQDESLHVVDFGSGKGYLTCAIYDYLQNQHYQPKVTGVELRPELVEFCQNVADQTGYSDLKFFEGDVRSYHPEKTDVVIALHACDIATDFAIHTGIRLGAKVVMCSPCCHKELRPQLKSPQVLQPMLQYGLHAGQQAEMLTDTLRALFLQAYGYETKVLEFVSLEHTSKNKMILAIKVKNLTIPDTKILQQIEALKDYYGVQKQSLQLLLNNEWDQQDIGCKC